MYFSLSTFSFRSVSVEYDLFCKTGPRSGTLARSMLVASERMNSFLLHDQTPADDDNDNDPTPTKQNPRGHIPLQVDRAP